MSKTFKFRPDKTDSDFPDDTTNGQEGSVT